MGRAAKYNWKNLYLEYCQGRYKSVAEFARKKDLNPNQTRTAFKKVQAESEKQDAKTTQNNTKKEHKKTQNNKAPQKQHSWQKLRKQFLDWPEEKLQAYLVQIEDRLDELKKIPFEELSQEEIKELGKLRRERRAILSDPDPETICKAVRNGKKCNNPVERGKEVCWNHGGAPGSGGQPGSKNALKTGEYETIWLDALDDDEKELLGQIPTDPLAQIDDKIRSLSIRERRMMKRIQDIKNGLTEKQRRVLQERKSTNEPVQIYDEKLGDTKVVKVPKTQLVVTELEETEYRPIEDILNLEEALTRVQDKLIKAIDMKHRMLLNGVLSEEHRLRLEKLRADIAKVKGEDEPTEDDGFMEALKGEVDEVWGDDDGEA